MTDLQIANMLADYHKECESVETLREKSDIQLKHARLIREELTPPFDIVRSEQLAAFTTWLSENHNIEIHDMILQDYIKYGG